MSCLALDIGGANLKIAHSDGYVSAEAFPLWQRSDELNDALRKLISDAPAAQTIVVTMTGELADCYASKAEGVNQIIGEVELATNGERLEIYLTDGRLVSAEEARQAPLLAAASNWHALATYAARYSGPEPAVLLDLGSTTCDIIPIEHGRVAALGKTDPERLVSGELVYSGVERSPICSLLNVIAWRGESCPVAQEVFATTLDAYLLLNELPEESCNIHTADGCPRTKACAHTRMARLVCADITMFSSADAELAAEAVHNAQTSLIREATEKAISRMDDLPALFITSGVGEFLLRTIISARKPAAKMLSLSDKLGPKASSAACAYALAVLASERGAS